MLLPKMVDEVGNMVVGPGRQALALGPYPKILGEGGLVVLLGREHLVQKSPPQ